MALETYILPPRTRAAADALLRNALQQKTTLPKWRDTEIAGQIELSLLRELCELPGIGKVKAFALIGLPKMIIDPTLMYRRARKRLRILLR